MVELKKKEDLVEEIKRLLEDANVSEVAYHLGTHASVISSLINDRGNISPKLAESLGYTRVYRFIKTSNE